MDGYLKCDCDAPHCHGSIDVYWSEIKGKKYLVIGMVGSFGNYEANIFLNEDGIKELIEILNGALDENKSSE